jgi:hypothetical protein
MIISIGSGRTGNLMFQLGGVCALRLDNREKLVLVNYFKLKQLFPSLVNYATLMAIPERVPRLLSFTYAALHFLVSLRVIGSIEETSPGSNSLVRRRGLFRIAFFRGGYCQSEEVISTELLEKLFEETVGKIDTISHSQQLQEAQRVCFVHVRRGDYLTFPAPEASLALPPCWFRRQILRISAAHPTTVFQFFSDDLEYVKTEFHDVPNAEFVEASTPRTFLLMAHADDGILSPSTFSWWAAYFAFLSSGGTFIAPQFWTGWRQNVWHPHEQIKASFLAYHHVDCPQL